MIIIIHCIHGLGNKIFDLIIGSYIQYLNGGQIYFVNVRGYHDKKTDSKIDEIFPNLKENIKFISETEMHNIKNNIKDKLLSLKKFHINSLDDLDFKNRYDGIYLFNIYYLYKYIYEIYKIFSEKINKNFKINNNLLNDKIKEISKTKYAALHIRYGDKLNISLEKDRTYDFLIYKPEFYIKMINKFIRKNIKVYIFSDDENIVKKFILDKIDNDLNKVELLQSTNVEALYLMSNAKYLVLSMSTLSIFAGLINKKLKRAYLVTRTRDIERFKQNEEFIINNIKWVKYSDKKYILNYDTKLIKNMIDSR